MLQFRLRVFFLRDRDARLCVSTVSYEKKTADILFIKKTLMLHFRLRVF